MLNHKILKVFLIDLAAIIIILALCLFLLKLHFYQLRAGKVTIVRMGQATVSAGIVRHGTAQGAKP